MLSNERLALEKKAEFSREKNITNCILICSTTMANFFSLVPHGLTVAIAIKTYIAGRHANRDEIWSILSVLNEKKTLFFIHSRFDTKTFKSNWQYSCNIFPSGNEKYRNIDSWLYRKDLLLLFFVISQHIFSWSELCTNL